MAEGLKPISVAECGQIKGLGCDACPLFDTARIVMASSKLNDTYVMSELALMCPPQARMDLAGLGIVDTRDIVRKPHVGFVR